MKHTVNLFLLFVTLSLPLSLAAQSGSEVYAGTNRAYAEADKKLNAAYQQLLKSIKADNDKERAQVKRGQKVFIPGGSGGIGTFAIQLAKDLGAKVGTTTSTGYVDLVQSLGADEVIDYKKQEFAEVLRNYDAVLGTIGGDSLEKSLRILKPQSHVVSLIGPPDAAFAHARGMNFSWCSCSGY